MVALSLHRLPSAMLCLTTLQLLSALQPVAPPPPRPRRLSRPPARRARTEQARSGDSACRQQPGGARSHRVAEQGTAGAGGATGAL